jgi:two-component system, cell cycle sensor histidine kinase and response regulator CckA
MTTPLRVLIVEDSERDAELLLLELGRCGYEVTSERVQAADTMRTALREPWDIILSDYSMPQFDARDALRLRAESGVDTPLIIVSGTIGEDVAVAALQAGAGDFLVKGKLSRLGPAIQRELREHASRAARREAESALRASEQRLRRLAESGIIGIVVADTSGRIVEVNDAFLQMVGYSRDELLSGSIRWDDMTPPELRPASEIALEQLKAKGVALPWEKECLRKDGTRVPVLVGVAMLEDPMTIGVVADLSERRRAEESLRRTETQLRQIQKMEAIGSLAGGIAHDFNNLLTVILSIGEMMVSDLRPGDPMRADAEQIVSAGERARALTRQLLAFSRQQVLEPRVLDLNQIVKGVETILRRLVGEHIEVTFVGAPNLGVVKVDPGQIEQVILNLAANARDAMPQGGKLTLETADIELDERYVRDHVGARAGPHVLLAVTDTGVGMDKDTQARMFEPFFTTKGKGKGTGFGLATVFGIVQQNGGNIWVYSEPGEGTSVKVYFPCSAEPIAPPSRPSEPAARRTVQGNETILLVEDDESVRGIICTILRRHGYHVLEAQNGGDALLLCEQHKATIDLLLTDVVMPRMSGRQLSERLRIVRPAMKVLYISGYTDNSVIHHGVLDSGVTFLQKPITPEALTKKVRDALERRT